MKVVKASEMGRIEKLAYDRGASEEEFMNRAGQGIAEHAQGFIGRYHLKPHIILLCGKGNNGGDAYVAGKILLDGGFDVRALSLSAFDVCSPLCQLQNTRFVMAGGKVDYPQTPDQIQFKDAELLIDGILGTGFHGEVTALYREAIDLANRSGISILSIDIPSGLDGNSGAIGGVAICAKETVCLGLPKTGLFIGEAWNYVGKVSVYDFGLDRAYLEEANGDFVLITEAMTQQLLPSMTRVRHKYQAGYVVGLGGSPGMPGAPLMASFAALRSGAGIVRLLHPAGMESELSSAPYEIIRQGYREGDIQTILDAMHRAAAVFIGPGIGLGIGISAGDLLKTLFERLDRPCVIDADALTLIAQKGLKVPPQAILTPHHGEMHRLLGLDKQLEHSELLRRSEEYANRHCVTLVLKGSPTFIFHPDQKPFVCVHGDPGMATAGSGDVLTGMIAGFLAQVHDPLKASLLGVQFHARAGEYAAAEKSSYCMVASDIIEALPRVFIAHLSCCTR